MFVATTSLIATGCQKHELPERDTYAAQVYVSRCGQCHAAFDPRAMTAEMWQVQVTMMEDKMRAARFEPLTAGERRAILDYLSRNAGSQ